jgi:hypothetical protein
MQRRRGDELVSPTRGHDILISNEHARVRELDRRRWERGKKRIRAEYDYRARRTS